jgi:hypothetical protein
MALTYQSVNVSPGASGTTCVIVAPTGITIGDLLIASVSFQTNDVITPSSGFTSIEKTSHNTGSTIESFYKVATSGDAAASDFTFTSAGSSANLGTMLRFSGQKSTSFIGVATETSGANGTTTINPAAVTTVLAADLVLLVAGSADANTWTLSAANGTATERTDINRVGASLAVATVPLNSVGTSGVLTMTRNNNNQELVGHAFVVFSGTDFIPKIIIF